MLSRFESYHADMIRKWKLIDSYKHYRTKVGHGPSTALYRTLYFETRKKEPKYYSFKDLLYKRFDYDICYHDWCFRSITYQYRCGRHQDDP